MTKRLLGLVFIGSMTVAGILVSGCASDPTPDARVPLPALPDAGPDGTPPAADAATVPDAAVPDAATPDAT